jgi:hypothetical protein
MPVHVMDLQILQIKLSSLLEIHINRMPETSVVKKIYKWKPLTGRPAGRPKCRWEDDIRNDMVQIVKWTEHVQDRPKWKVIVEKAKTLPEL